ncbi:hypothetical protein KPL74_14150 [Bacillus sp. NP157]|nr:hypothetical protein KPL74_14150 [Bacillus sp. NP157]
MEFQAAVWYPHSPLTQKQADVRIDALCDDEDLCIRDHPALDAFYDEIMQVYPDPGFDRYYFNDATPWVDEVQRGRGMVFFFVKVEWGDELWTVIRDVAHRHGLAAYDLMSGRYWPPGSFPEAEQPKQWWRIF